MWNYWYSMDNFRGFILWYIYIGIMSTEDNAEPIKEEVVDGIKYNHISENYYTKEDDDKNANKEDDIELFEYKNGRMRLLNTEKALKIKDKFNKPKLITDDKNINIEERFNKRNIGLRLNKLRDIMNKNGFDDVFTNLQEENSNLQEENSILQEENSNLHKCCMNKNGAGKRRSKKKSSKRKSKRKSSKKGRKSRRKRRTRK